MRQAQGYSGSECERARSSHRPILPSLEAFLTVKLFPEAMPPVAVPVNVVDGIPLLAVVKANFATFLPSCLLLP